MPILLYTLSRDLLKHKLGRGTVYMPQSYVSYRPNHIIGYKSSHPKHHLLPMFITKCPTEHQ
jgi:hypothetical protein